MKKELYDEYLKKGFILAPLNTNTKQPKNKRKSDGKCRDRNYAYNKNYIYYAVPTKNILVIDVDVKNGKRGLESLAKLEEDLLTDLTPTVETGSGGLHIYCKIDKPVKAYQENYPDIDFQCYRADETLCAPYVVCGGQEFEYDGKPYRYTMLQDEIIFNELGDITDVLEEDLIISLDEDIGDFTIPTEHPERVLTLLENIDPCCDEPTWFKIGSALKNEVVDGFEVFNTWSKGCPEKYDPETTKRKWETIVPKGHVGTIYNLSKNYKLKKALGLIEKSDSKSAIEKMVNSKRWNNEPIFKDEEISKLATKIKDKFEITLPNARKLLTPTEVSPEAVEVDVLKEVVYVESYNKSQKYVVLSSGERLSNLAMSGRYKADLDVLKKILRIKTPLTFDTLVKNGFITVCSDHQYIPHIPKKVVNINGATIYNPFDPSTLPPIAEEFTPKGKELIDAFVKHLHYTMQETEVKTLLDYLAFITQNMGTKVLWCPLIQSEQGLGKSIIGKLMITHIFGENNSGVVDSNVVNSPNTSWATNSVFKVLEEIKLDGHNRYEVINRLKPFITEPRVSRVEKYEASSEVPNYTNFIALTNYKDAIPIKDGDRRWWVVFYKLKNLEELEEVSNKNRNEYFAPLYELLYSKQYGKEFKKWLMEYEISADFNPNFPPESLHKSMMIATEETKTEYLVEIKDIISDGYRGITEEVISSKQMQRLMHSSVWEDEPLRTSALSRLLRTVGYSKFPSRIKYNGERHYLWGKNISYEEGRKLFLESMATGRKLDLFDDVDDNDEY